MTTNIISSSEKKRFQQLIWDYYQTHGRKFSWRNTQNPYEIFISEIMLQQTQTYRVEAKYQEFITTFDSFYTVAHAPFSLILATWQGLGYNRRAKYIHETAKRIVAECNSILPNNPEILETFPGIGPNTAGSICAFAYNTPTIFIETNIRAVYIHFFFQDKDSVHDNEIKKLVEQTCDTTNPRTWYYALMDYGVMLKKKYKNPSRKSKHHTIQTKFHGSDRQIRGQILKLLVKSPKLYSYEIAELIQADLQRVKRILDDLVHEKFLVLDNQQIAINDHTT